MILDNLEIILVSLFIIFYIYLMFRIISTCDDFIEELEDITAYLNNLKGIK